MTIKYLNLVSTFNMKYKTDGGYATTVVDMIFVSDDIVLSEKEVLEEDLSDLGGF